MGKTTQTERNKKNAITILLVLGILFVVGLAGSFVANRLFAPESDSSLVSQTLLDNRSRQSMVEAIAISVIVLALGLILVFRYGKSTMLLIADCFLLAILVALPMVLTGYFYAKPNGEARSYFSQRCGDHPNVVPSNLPQDFVCSAMLQKYGWPLTNAEVYTQITSADPRIDTSSFIALSNASDSKYTGLKSPTRAISAMYYLAIAVWVVIILSLPISSFKAWRQKVEGRTTFVLASSSIVLLLVIGAYGLWSTGGW